MQDDGRLVEAIKDAVRETMLEISGSDVLEWGAGKITTAVLSAIERDGWRVVPRDEWDAHSPSPPPA